LARDALDELSLFKAAGSEQIENLLHQIQVELKQMWVILAAN